MQVQPLAVQDMFDTIQNALPVLPEVPDVPASAFGSGTYDAYHAERRAAKGKSKCKSKSKSKKGKDSDLNRGRNQTNWWNRDLWSYDRS